MRFDASVTSHLSLDEAVPGASGSVKDSAEDVDVESIVRVVRNHLNSLAGDVAIERVTIDVVRHGQ